MGTPRFAAEAQADVRILLSENFSIVEQTVVCLCQSRLERG